MRRQFLPLVPVFALVLLLAGCGSSPVNNYYVLSAREAPAASGNTPSLGIGPIEVPEYLSRSRMVFNRTGNALQVASVDLWGEPLTDGVQRVLVLNLAGLLQTQDVQYFPWHPTRAPQYGITVNVLQLETVGQQASLTAEWLVYRTSDAKPVQRRISQLQAPLAAGTTEAERVAAAYSDLLYQLSAVIAAAITADGSGSHAAAMP